MSATAVMAPVKLLIVEDDDSYGRDLKRALKAVSTSKLNIDSVNSIKALQEVLGTKQYDLISIDWQFQDNTLDEGSYGNEFFNEIRSKTPNGRVVVFSNDVSTLTSFRDQINGADFVLTKRPEASSEYIEQFSKLIEDRFQSINNLEEKPEPELILPVRNTLAVVNDRLTRIFRVNPELLRTIDPFLFETVVAELFEEDGYEVVLTPKRADGGKDIYVTKTDPLTRSRFLVECKRYTPPHNVDVSIARQLYGVVQQERASGGIIVTTSYFTKPAKEFAETIPYHLFLRDFDDITHWLKKAKISS